MEPFKDLKTQTPFSGVYMHKDFIFNTHIYVYIYLHMFWLNLSLLPFGSKTNWGVSRRRAFAVHSFWG